MYTSKRVQNKHIKTVIGVLSGTSINSVDAVLMKIEGYGVDSKIQIIDFMSNRIPIKLKNYILKTSEKKSGSVEDVCILNFIIGRLFARTVKKLIKKNNLKPENIDYIGSHGQTIYHIPHILEKYGFRTKSTLQIGDPSVIANITGITTVGDFRVADVAAGGDGAPLVPYLDFVVFRNAKKPCLLINIGGIANITYLKEFCRINDVIAFDSGPGNMLIDSLMYKFYNKDFDKNGETGIIGKFNKSLFEKIVYFDSYLNKKPPKSTGREHYGNKFINFILKNTKALKYEDVIRTVTEYTSFCIFHNFKKFIRSKKPLKTILISGGGAKNKCIINALNKYFPESRINILDKHSINSLNKEAVLFGILANETMHRNCSNLPSVTGAARNVILGKICYSN